MLAVDEVCRPTIYRTVLLRLSYNIAIMFCPNCAAQNDESQHYCRMCGLRLDAIALELTAQQPLDETAVLLKRKRRAQTLGMASLSISGVMGLILVAQALYYKFLLFAPVLLSGSAIGALILFMLASVFFFNYPKFFLKLDRVNPRFREQVEVATHTNKLLNDPPFEPASVTEHSTELLRRKT